MTWKWRRPLRCSFGTAYHCLITKGGLGEKETVLIQAAAGGVGLAAIQLARDAGATVIAVAGGSERQARLTELGASHVIDRLEKDVVEEVLRLTGGKGADLVIDPVGSTLQASLSALAPEGRLVFVGNAGVAALMSIFGSRCRTIRRFTACSWDRFSRGQP
ncbi:zinc-binding dehydrogenase [Rhizobium sullae]|nr:zinc-binding dehydrogenase [Rhizobium sullae]